MSTRFYPRQTDYITQLNLLDDAAQLAITKGDLAAKWATQTTGEVVTGQGYSAYYYANQAVQTLTTVNTAVALAQSWASQASGVVNGTAFFSASKYAADASGSATTASLWATSMSAVQTGLYGAKYYATDASTSATTAKNWATQATTEVVAGQGYSAKQYATNASGSATSAQNWATQLTTEVVAGQGYSAKQYATNASGSATLAQSWASQTTGVVNGTAYYSAYYYATQASTSAGNAAQTLTDTNTAKTAAQTAQTAAQNWATQATGEVVVGQGYSAKYNATAAAVSAALAQAWASQATGVVSGTASYSAAYYAKQAQDAAAVATGGQVNADWNATSGLSQILNKPVVPVVYPAPWNSSTSGWVKLGTFSVASQGGQTLRLEITGHQGYNSSPLQSQLTVLVFKTGNGTSFDGNGFSGDGFWYTLGAAGYGNNVPAGIKVKADAAGAAARNYDVWISQATFMDNSFYEVKMTYGASGICSWTNNNPATVGQADPGVASSTICVPLLSIPSFNGQTLLHNGNYSTYALPVTGGTLTGNLFMTGPAPGLHMIESDQTGALGKWRMVVDNGQWRLDRSTDVAANGFATITSDIYVGTTGIVSIPQLTVATTAIVPNATQGDNSFNAANTRYVDAAIGTRLPTAGGTMTGALGLSGTVPQFVFTETDQTGALGKWRVVGDGGEYLIDRNTSAARDFSTYVRDFKIGTDGVVTMPSATVSTLLTSGGLLNVTGQLQCIGLQPVQIFNETDQAGAVGYWRNVGDNGAFAIDRNTTTARDFSTFARDFSITTAGVVTIPKLSVTNQMQSTVAVYAQAGLDGEVQIGNDSNGSIEIGKTGRVAAGSPYIDFHSSINSGDFDVRVIATGGNATSGSGMLNVMATDLQVNGAGILAALNTKETKSWKNAPGGYAGLTAGNQIQLLNTAGTYTSILQNINTAARVYTFPDKDITVAGTTNETFINPTFKGYIEQLQALNPGAAVTINTANGTLIEITTTANIAITLPAAVAGVSYTLIIIYGGAHTITFSGGTTLNWQGGTAPSATMVAGKKDKYLFTCGSGYTLAQDSGRNF